MKSAARSADVVHHLHRQLIRQLTTPAKTLPKFDRITWSQTLALVLRSRGLCEGAHLRDSAFWWRYRVCFQRQSKLVFMPRTMRIELGNPHVHCDCNQPRLST